MSNKIYVFEVWVERTRQRGQDNHKDNEQMGRTDISCEVVNQKVKKK